MAISGVEKLKLVRELGLIKNNFSTAKGINKLTLAKRINEIRALLSVKAEKGLELVIDPANKDGSFIALTSYVKDEIGKNPTALQLSELDASFFIKNILITLPGGENTESQYNSEFKNAAENFRELYNNKNQSKIAAFEYFKDNGSAFTVDTEKVKAILAEIKDINSKAPEDSPETLKMIEDAKLELASLNEKMYTLIKINARNGYDQESIDKAAAEYASVYKIHHDVWVYRNGLGEQKYTDRQAKINDLRAYIYADGETVINTLLDSSTVTKEQADTWAGQQVIDKSIATRLKKQGYPVEDIRRDMSEFYRLTRGKLRSIGIQATGVKRAHASGIGAVEGSYITPGSNFTKTTLWHELAHHLEADPAARNAANGFLLKRRESEETYSLKSLTGNPGYKNDEYAYKDEFIDHYIGKVYSHGDTEVFSMGLQYLSNPADAAMMLVRDPEMAAMIIGYIQADLSPAMKALQSIQDNAKGNNEKYREETKNEYQQAVSRLAAMVNLVDDGWYLRLAENEKELMSRFIFRDSDAQFIGSWDNIRVFSGKFKKRKGRRIAKGYVAIAMDSDHFIQSSDGVWRSMPETAIIHEDYETMKAGLKIASEFENRDIYRISWRLFGNADTQSQIINYAKRIFGASNE